MLTAQDTLDLARAIRRCGELLKQIERDKGTAGRKGIGRSEPSLQSRKSAADAAGLSDRRRKDALRVASIPADDFERGGFVASATARSLRFVASAWGRRGMTEIRAAKIEARREAESSGRTSAQKSDGLVGNEFLLCDRVARHGEPRELMQGRA